MGMRDEYTDQNKLQALLSPDSEYGMLCRQGVLERFGKDNFGMLSDRIADILGQDSFCDELSARMNDLQALCDKLREAAVIPSDAIHELPQELFLQIFPKYVQAMSRTNYYLSPEELLALCYCLKLNVVIFQLDEVQNTLAYLDHVSSNTNTENIYISINVVAGRTVQRTHFERLEQFESVPSPQFFAVGNNSREQGSSIEEKELDGLPPPRPHSAKRPRMSPN